MALPPGTRIGPFEIAAQIGEGGMGEVYRAVDSNLGRSVAIKVLPDSVARDADRLARFEREAKTLASLNHPNIAQVFGLEKSPAEAGHHLALVMELVEGPTLADRIAAGPVALDESIAIAIQIAEALETAHEQGIVHRDLKPANVKVRDDGTVKVLDFGLAKAMDPGTGSRETGAASVANSPTITTPAMTQAGVILGTAAYMSPEQAKGRAVNQRADIWAFGCVLFEMLSGSRAFAGEDISDVLVSVLRDEPDWERLPASTPAHVRALLRRCLQKDVKKRLPHIGVARMELAEGGVSAVVPAAAQVPAGARVFERLAWALAGAAVVGGVAFALRPAPPVAEPPRIVQFEIPPPEGGVFQGSQGAPRFAVSPDGLSVVYQASAPGQGPRLWLRRFDRQAVRPLAPTETAGHDLSAQQPFWSPDSRQVAFFDETVRKLKIADVETGSVRVLCDVPGNQLAGTWSADGVILFASVETQGIQRVAASGGATTQVTNVDRSRDEASHLWPDFLPDGKHFVYLVSGGGAPGVYVGSIDGGEPRRLIQSAFMARVAPPDRLLLVRDDGLVAQRLDLQRLELAGEPAPITDFILRTQAGRVAVSASRHGDLVFATGDSTSEPAEAVWMSRAGAVDTTISPIPTEGTSLRLSPDGRTVAFMRSSGTGGEVWIYDVARRIPTRLSSGAADFAPVFSPDGLHTYFRRDLGPDGVVIVRQTVSGASAGSTLLEVDRTELVTPQGASPDGRFLLVASTKRGQSRGLWLLPLSGGGEATRYLDGTRARALQAALSPDGRFVAHGAVQGSLSQVFLQTFPDPSLGRWPVSAPGGHTPRWRGDGKELFFVDAQGWVSSVAVNAGRDVQVGEPARLFELPDYANRNATTSAAFDVSPDGQRFIVQRRRGVGKPVSLTVAINRMASLDAAPVP